MCSGEKNFTFESENVRNKSYRLKAKIKKIITLKSMSRVFFIGKI